MHACMPTWFFMYTPGGNLQHDTADLCYHSPTFNKGNATVTWLRLVGQQAGLSTLTWPGLVCLE